MTPAPFLFALHDHDSLALYRRDLFERVVLAKFKCADWSASGTLVSLRVSEENLADRTSLMHAAVKPRVVSAIMSQGEVLKN